MEGDRVRLFLAGLLLATSVVSGVPAQSVAQPAPAPGGEVAIQFEWLSTKPYAGQFHDVVQFRAAAEGVTPTGTWARLANDPEGVINEDRVSLMLEDPARPVPHFAKQGCYVACHSDMNDMPAQGPDARHYLLPREGFGALSFGLDMWHWRGGRSGPMGFAEDTWVRTHLAGTGAQGRQRDAAPLKPVSWVNSGGDNLHENQPFGSAIAWKGVPLPRFVFDPERSGFDNYFLAEDGVAITDPEGLQDIANDQYASQMVVYQDYGFDAEDKVNSIDVRYLLFRAGAIADPGFNGGWHSFWASRLPSIDSADSAAAMLDDIIAHVEDGVLITRVVGFIYPSGQHDISATREFTYDAERGTWKVTLYRALSTGNTDDVDLAGLADGTVYNFAFAVHDIIVDDGLTHHISLPLTLGKAASSLTAVEVPNTRDVDWAGLPEYKTTLFQPGTVSLQHLLDADKHRRGGADGVSKGQACSSCHTVRGLNLQSRDFVPEGTEAPPVPVTVRAVYGFNAEPPAPVISISGDDRYETAVAASLAAYPDGLDPAGAKTVIVATGLNWPDALGGAALAGALDGPVLLVKSNSAPAAVRGEIKRLGAEKVIIIGGESAVGPRVFDTLKAAELDVTRIWGDDRYETADKVALRVIDELGAGYDGTALFATGASFADAVAAAPLAAGKKWPLFLVHPATGIGAGTWAAMSDVDGAVILGGKAAVSTAVAKSLKDAPGVANVDRLGGDDRYETAAKIAKYGVDEAGLGWNLVAITTGEDFPDALAGGVLQGNVGSVMLLTRRTALHAETRRALADNSDAITTVTFLGGLDAVNESVRTAVKAAAKIAD